jgi:hypothetical protein
VGVAAACALGAALAIVLSSSNDGPSRTTKPSGLAAPVAAGTSAGNVPLNGAGKRVLLRWVARSSGTMVGLHLRIQANGSGCRLNGKTGYGLGNGGSWQVTTHPVLPDGRPDEATTLSSGRFRPCEASPGVVDVRQGIVRVAMQLPVERGQEFATVIRNADPDPAHNYTSANFLYTSSGIIGANGRNERDPKAPDAYYGLDPRELVGYTQDNGQNWSLPGGPYGNPGGRNFLPTYLQEYADGRITGQPYYYATTATTSPRTVLYMNGRKPWTVRELGAFTPTQGRGTLTLVVDGRPVRTVTVEGSGMLRATVPPTTINPGQTAGVTATGLALQDIVADTAWGRLAGMERPTAPRQLHVGANFSRVAPVYPLPRPPLPPPTG